MAEPEQIDIPVGWGKISVQIFGDSKSSTAKPIVAIHGYLDNSNSFKPIANYLTQSGAYYVIAIDLPGMGFSSNIPDGIPYTLKFYLMSVRRVVMYLKLEKFFLAAHSFGGSIALTYSACYHEEIYGIVLFDFAMRTCDFEKKETITECWREELEDFVKAEIKQEERNKTRVAREITTEHALKRLLESNSHIDETAAKILLERGLILKNNNLQYTRDIKLVTSTTIREFHSEYNGRSIFDLIKNPVVQIYATPPPYGEYTFNKMIEAVTRIKNKSESTFDLIPFEGTHHFHMLNPSGAAEVALKFLNEKNMDVLSENQVLIE